MVASTVKNLIELAELSKLTDKSNIVSWLFFFFYRLLLLRFCCCAFFFASFCSLRVPGCRAEKITRIVFFFFFAFEWCKIVTLFNFFVCVCVIECYLSGLVLLLRVITVVVCILLCIFHSVINDNGQLHTFCLHSLPHLVIVSRPRNCQYFSRNKLELNCLGTFV